MEAYFIQLLFLACLDNTVFNTHGLHPFPTFLIDKLLKLNHLQSFIFHFTISFLSFGGIMLFIVHFSPWKNNTFLLNLPFLPFCCRLLFLSLGTYGFRPIPFFFLIFYLLQGCMLQGYMFVLQSPRKVWILSHWEV